MRSVISSELIDLSTIYDEDVELVSVARPSTCPHLPRIHDLSKPTLQLQWQQRAEDRKAVSRAFAGAGETRLVGTLTDEICNATSIMNELLGCEHVGIRVRTLLNPMCPRFHTDKVPCRMLITVAGPGTEWIPNDALSRFPRADSNTDSVEWQHSESVRQLNTGHWSLLKGGTWSDQFHGVVHRSPPQEGQRLLVSVDPIFG